MSFSKKGLFLFCIWSLFLTLILCGLYRLKNTPDIGSTDIRLRLVVTPTSNATTPHEEREKSLLKTLELSTQKPLEDIDLLIWPETSIRYVISNLPERRFNEFQPILKKYIPKKTTFAGGLLILQYKDKEAKNIDYFHNGILYYKDGRIIKTSKQHNLVPYTQYTPWLIKKLISFPNILTSTKGLALKRKRDFSAIPALKTVTLPSLPPFSPLICYEVVFPGEVVDKRNRPQWLLNIASDYYFQGTNEIPQFFQISRFRSVEEGLPLVRVSEGGESGVVDAYGRVLHHFFSNPEGEMVDVTLPKHLSKPTFYAKYGNILFWIFISLIFANTFYHYSGTKRKTGTHVTKSNKPP